MDSVITAILLLLLALTSLLLTLTSRGKGRLPPGPKPLPLLENLLQLHSQDMLTSLTKLSKEYGSAYTVHLRPRHMVVLSGYRVKEALVDQGDEGFSGHGYYPIFFNFTKGNGIIFSSGNRWKVLRSFPGKILWNFGMGKRSIAERIQEEGNFLLAELRKTEGESFDPTFVLSCSLSSIISSLLFGSRFDYNDDHLLTIISLINDNFKIMSSPWGEMYNLFPSLLDWVPGPHRRLFQNFGHMKDLIASSVCDHQASLDPSFPRDFINCFLTKMAQKQDPLSHLYMDTLLMTTHNLLFGGTETVGTTLRHAFLVLMKYPEAQARVQEEIDSVVGRARLPSLEARTAMAYTDAVIHVVQRFADAIPMNLPHRVIQDTAFRGFLLPKGTDVITLPHNVHYDPSRFLTPKKCNPQHFLDENQSFKNSPAFMPFSAGRRLCLGESLGWRMELFLYLTAILQSFSLQPLGAPEDIDLTPICSGLGNLPRPFQKCLRARERPSLGRSRFARAGDEARPQGLLRPSFCASVCPHPSRCHTLFPAPSALHLPIPHPSHLYGICAPRGRERHGGGGVCPYFTHSTYPITRPFLGFLYPFLINYNRFKPVLAELRGEGRPLRTGGGAVWLQRGKSCGESTLPLGASAVEESCFLETGWKAKDVRPEDKETKKQRRQSREIPNRGRLGDTRRTVQRQNYKQRESKRLGDRTVLETGRGITITNTQCLP
ncbi:LOW QUALITY PROTEIN: cytochrome P450 2F1-like [Trichechus inunguis]